MDVDVGHNQQLAGFIHDRVQADIFEVEPADGYPDDYDELDRIAEDEAQNRILEFRVGPQRTTARML
jgi:hypothetical protein